MSEFGIGIWDLNYRFRDSGLGFGMIISTSWVGNIIKIVSLRYPIYKGMGIRMIWSCIFCAKFPDPVKSVHSESHNYFEPWQKYPGGQSFSFGEALPSGQKCPGKHPSSGSASPSIVQDFPASHLIFPAVPPGQ